jgi:hypothetical protein
LHSRPGQLSQAAIIPLTGLGIEDRSILTIVLGLMTIVKIIKTVFIKTGTIISETKTICFVSNTNVFAFDAMLIASKTSVIATKTIVFTAMTNVFIPESFVFVSNTIVSITVTIAGAMPAAVSLSINHQPGGIPMSQNARAVDVSRRLTAEQLVAACGGIIKGLADNPAFPSPPVDLKTLQTAVDDLSAALSAQAHGGTAATAEKNNKQADLIRMMRKLKHYVEDNCGNDVAVLLTSGFPAAQITRNRAPLANPSILNIDSGNRGELVLKTTPVARAKCYEAQSAAMDANNTPGPWQPAGLFTSARSMKISNLAPGTTYAFQVRAVGGSTGYSDWSNSVSRMCA